MVPRSECCKSETAATCVHFVGFTPGVAVGVVALDSAQVGGATVPASSIQKVTHDTYPETCNKQQQFFFTKFNFFLLEENGHQCFPDNNQTILSGGLTPCRHLGPF